MIAGLERVVVLELVDQEAGEAVADGVGDGVVGFEQAAGADEQVLELQLAVAAALVGVVDDDASEFVDDRSAAAEDDLGAQGVASLIEVGHGLADGQMSVPRPAGFASGVADAQRGRRGVLEQSKQLAGVVAGVLEAFEEGLELDEAEVEPVCVVGAAVALVNGVLEIGDEGVDVGLASLHFGAVLLGAIPVLMQGAGDGFKVGQFDAGVESGEQRLGEGFVVEEFVERLLPALGEFQ